jgi:hypothetical protein
MMLALLGPDGAADTDLLGPLGHGDEHDVHDADAGRDQGDGGDDGGPDAEVLGEAAELRDERIVGDQFEVIVLAGGDLADGTEDAADLFDRRGVGGFVGGLHLDLERESSLPYRSKAVSMGMARKLSWSLAEQPHPCPRGHR